MASTYAQPGPKRQRVKDVKATENTDYFQGIDKVEYNSMAGSQEAGYRHYHAGERVNGRAMEEWLKYSVSLTEFRSNGSDKHGRPTYQRAWDDHTSSLDSYKRCIKACFDFCSKLGVKYFTAFDSDLVPPADSWEENKSNWEDVTEFIQENVQRTHVKLLWIAPDLHSHARFASGAMTSNDAITFAHAASQIKKCLEISQRLNCECFLLWPHREGYESLFQSDIAREIKLFSKLLKITADYKERLAYRCQMLIMPYYRSSYGSGNQEYDRSFREEDRIHRYMWDVTSCLFFLKNYNLERFYKVCAPPGHHMFMANVYNMLGGVFLSDEWNQYDSRRLTLMMKCIIDQGACPAAGINLKLTPRRDGTELRDLVCAYSRCVDAGARALRAACGVASEQVFSKHLQQRYSSYHSGYGARMVSGELSMEECEEYYKKNQHQSHEQSTSKADHMEMVFQRYIDSCEQI
ncbi:hypothetical protein JYU34_020978 [Plutella xylostella]|uniref:Xylose isomerase n=1 Tax=Plutella xylostella TaxID=51655 RepID=A0ABQ7PTS7_PLUXY|nr:hypothetical protein JYU34_020978 [Plutella xylostella]